MTDAMRHSDQLPATLPPPSTGWGDTPTPTPCLARFRSAGGGGGVCGRLAPRYAETRNTKYYGCTRYRMAAPAVAVRARANSARNPRT